jgi:hypothetical protein
MAIRKPTLGGDPEFFVYIKDGDKLIIQSADKFLPPKGLPGIAILEKSKMTCGNYHFDGVQAEINPLPAQCRHDITFYTWGCLYQVYQLAKAKYPKKEIIIAPLASITVTPEDIKDTDMECRRFGCSPDINIYDDKQIRYPDGNKFMTRFSGGHIHFGFDQLDYATKFKQEGKLLSLIKVLDIIPGVITTAISGGEEEKIRREWYGKAGSYRVQRHGIEYRTLSSFWMVSPQLLSLTYGLFRDACLTVFWDKEDILLKEIGDIEEVRRIINEVDVKAAQELYFKKIKPFYLEHLVKNTSSMPTLDDNFECLIDNSPLKSEIGREVIENMIKNSYKVYFNPLDAKHYWRLDVDKPVDFNSGFGIYTFASEIKLRGVKKAIEAVRGIR